MSDGSRIIAAALLLFWGAGSATARGDDDPWADFRFMMGEWVGDGEGMPGRASGGFSLSPDLQARVLVRRNRAQFPAAGGRPASTHDDLMVIFREEVGKPIRASYFDSEGHVIQYTVSASKDKRRLVFVSDPRPAAPRFRLTYEEGRPDTLSIRFQIAPPDRSDQFETYLDGTARRKGTGKPK